MFGRRFNLFTFAGIRIGIDLSWFFIAVLLSWTLAYGYFPYNYPNLPVETYWAMGIIGMLGLFVCVILHELGHAMVAKHYKLPISQITLFIFGGVAEIKQEPKSPKVEFLMAIAGPIVSVVLFVGLYLLTLIGDLYAWPVVVRGVTKYLTLINAVIVIFNMIPAFPLDGGRVFRAILWHWKKNLNWATQIVTRMGSAFGFILIFLGIFSFIGGNFIGGIWFAILGLFLQKAASSSRTQYVVGKALKGEKVEKFMTADPDAVPAGISVKQFIDKYVYRSHHHLYPVTEDGKLVGYISLKEAKSITSSQWPKTLVKKVMVPRSRFKTVAPETSALAALNLMNETEVTALLVVKGNSLAGIITAQDLFKVILVKLDLEEHGRS